MKTLYTHAPSGPSGKSQVGRQPYRDRMHGSSMAVMGRDGPNTHTRVPTYTGHKGSAQLLGSPWKGLIWALGGAWPAGLEIGTPSTTGGQKEMRVLPGSCRMPGPVPGMAACDPPVTRGALQARQSLSGTHSLRKKKRPRVSEDQRRLEESKNVKRIVKSQRIIF